MEDQETPRNTDQQEFDDQVNRIGGRILKILAGVGIVAALIMSTIALSTTNTTTTARSTAPAVTATAPPTSARIAIVHVTHGCHTLAVNGAAPGMPSATLHLTTGGMLNVQNSDVMPQRLVLVSGPHAQLAAAAMNHMGATSTVTFPTAGTYTLTTKAGEDYSKGIVTTGNDNTLRITVVVRSAASAQNS